MMRYLEQSIFQTLKLFLSYNPILTHQKPFVKMKDVLLMFLGDTCGCSKNWMSMWQIILLRLFVDVAWSSNLSDDGSLDEKIRFVYDRLDFIKYENLSNMPCDRWEGRTQLQICDVHHGNLQNNVLLDLRIYSNNISWKPWLRQVSVRLVNFR